MAVEESPVLLHNTMATAKAGFTLVEVIVVLVILAILAAIAIPALTGYIDKADDKKYISDARNAAVAIRSLISEAYAEGLESKVPDDQKYRLTSGEHAYDSSDLKYFNINWISTYAGGASYAFHIEAGDLIGVPFPAEEKDPGRWGFALLAARSSADTVFNAPAFYYSYAPEGYNYPAGSHPNAPVICVTYKIGMDSDAIIATLSDFETALKTKAQYNPDAGYNVYHVTTT
jgi:prepilin-type N-terminal cleavage/methylation domain-containing protein